MQKVKDFFEIHAFGDCTAIGERLGIATTKIRMWFIYISFLTFGSPVIMDCTHSLQQPNQTSGVTGGNPQLIETIAKAAIATGAHGLFIETHPNPAQAKSDGANMLPLDKLAPLLEKLVKLRKAVI